MSKNISRRSFLQRSAMAAAGAALATTPMWTASAAEPAKKKKKEAATDRLNIVGVGIGGRGAADIDAMASQNIVALCDCDWNYAAAEMEKYPNAKKYKDYRKMFDEIGNEFDAVVVGTADHTHACIAAAALAMGKHVYCEKPLTHTVYETRLLTKLAASQKVATQMGNQGASLNTTRAIIEAIQGGLIGEVTRVDAFTDRPIWPQGLETPAGVDPIPDTLDWDLFIGPAKYRPFNTIYHPWNWRGWWDFGTGALGDMACHIMQPIVDALKLGSPISCQGSSTNLMVDCAPNAQIVKFKFPARDNMPKVAMPAVEVTWYDGGLKPEFPQGWPLGKDMNHSGGACIFYGSKDVLICGCYGTNPWLLSGRTIPAPSTTREVEGEDHQMDFVRACKESADNRILTKSDFSSAGPLNEMVVMGVLAVRLQGLNRELMWDGKNMKFTNIGDNENLTFKVKDGFSVHDGHPTFKNTYTDPINAQAFAAELIKHTYREGYDLPAMPL
ncbi:MAG: Gfo/Idh/MocA family oxidoreductase [Bacteroidales bacterium]|nr:Gfo/Idh/MocA family oxidoreductase [Bacteroidales bacterium]